MLNDWRGMDKEKATDYIIKCQVRTHTGSCDPVPAPCCLMWKLLLAVI